MINRRDFLAAAVTAALLASSPALAQEALPVVASFSIIGDLVKQVGGARVAVTTLVGPNADAHVYSPTPADGKTVASARLIFVNGLKFEHGWMTKLVAASGSKVTPVSVSDGIAVLKVPGQKGHDHGSKDKHGHEHRGESDPHAWQDVKNVRTYVENIRDALVAADAAGKDDYIRNATAYLAQLDALDADIRAAIGKIPAAQRKAIISHDALAYFARAYGLTLVA
ncbi:MAG: metal ABC transporter solute-binding protein, Zn/Mn family, partial [Beijerinckiaceae bacterium]